MFRGATATLSWPVLVQCIVPATYLWVTASSRRRRRWGTGFRRVIAIFSRVVLLMNMSYLPLLGGALSLP